MGRLMRSVRRLGGLFGTTDRDRDFDEELQSHLEMHVEDNLRAGMSPEEARRAALVRLGGMTGIREQHRSGRSLPTLENLWRDASYACRMMRRSKLFTLVAVLALAIGIGVNTAVFTAFDALALRPLEVKDPDGLARIYRSTPDDLYGPWSLGDYEYIRERSRTMADMAMLAFGTTFTSDEVRAARPIVPRLAGALGFHLPQVVEGGARPIGGPFVTGNYFSMLGASAIHGRLILSSDDVAGAAAVVVLGGNFWMRQFEGDAGVVGSTLHLNGVPFTIIGITPVNYLGTAASVPDIWMPVAAKTKFGVTLERLRDPAVPSGWVEGRRRDGVSLAEARAELNVLARRIADADPRRSRKATVTVTSGKSYAPPFDATAWGVIAASLVAVLLLLLIACTNVSGLLLARAAVRRREIAMRLALGAGRARLLQQLLTESTLLALLAGATGLLMSWWLLRLLIASVASSLPEYWGTIVMETAPNVRIFACALMVSLAVGLIGLAPALHSSGININGALKEDGGGDTLAIRRGRLLQLSVCIQIAACLVLLISSALLLRSSREALRADLGFDAHRVIQLQIFRRSQDGAPELSAAEAYRRLSDEIVGLKGVQAVARAARSPMFGGNWRTAMTLDGTTADSSVRTAGVRFTLVDSRYFEVLGVPILSGRAFTTAESDAGAPVAVISASTAARYFPGTPVIGQHIVVGNPSHSVDDPDGPALPPMRRVQIVGIAQDIRSVSVREIDESALYLPLPARNRRDATMLVRAEGSAATLMPSIAAAVRRVDPRVPVVAGVLDEMASQDPRFVVSRIGGALAAIVASVGLLMACLGVSGLVGYAVAQRTHEIGIRMALGAQPRQVLRLVLEQGVRPIILGVVAGLTGASLVAKAIASMLYGIPPLDLVSFAASSLALGLAALVAILIPASRATRVDPLVAIRHE